MPRVSASKNQSNAQGGKSKNPFFQNFFNCLVDNSLIPSILSKILLFSHQMRKFALIIEGRVLFEPPCKNQIANSKELIMSTKTQTLTTNHEFSPLEVDAEGACLLSNWANQPFITFYAKQTQSVVSLSNLFPKSQNERKYCYKKGL